MYRQWEDETENRIKVTEYIKNLSKEEYEKLRKRSKEGL